MTRVLSMRGWRSICFGAASIGLAAALVCAAVAEHRPQPAEGQAVQLRRPVAAGFLDDGRTLCVGNQRSGTVSLVDVPRARILGETAVGKHLADLVVTPDRKHVLAVD